MGSKLKNFVSVIIPCYNQAAYLGAALDAVLAQTHPDWECIIVNDGSPDDTEAIALGYSAMDTRFKYVKKENGGLSSARNEGLRQAAGDWIQFLDSDDYIAPGKLKSSLECLIKDPEINLFVTDFKMFTQAPDDATTAFCSLKQELLNLDDLLNGWGGSFAIPIHCGLFSKHFFNEIRFNEDFKAIEDWLMWIEIFKTDVKARYLPLPLAYYRNNPASMTKNKVNFRKSLSDAQLHILEMVDPGLAVGFAKTIIGRLHDEIRQKELDLDGLKKKKAYRLEIYLKSKLRAILK